MLASRTRDLPGIPLLLGKRLVNRASILAPKVA
jgi:hypothetical protein